VGDNKSSQKGGISQCLKRNIPLEKSHVLNAVRCIQAEGIVHLNAVRGLGIERISLKQQNGGVQSDQGYGFVFSNDIKDWTRGTNLRSNDSRKLAYHRNKAKTILFSSNSKK